MSFSGSECDLFVVSEKYTGVWPHALELCLRAALARLFCPEPPVPQIQGLV